MKIGIFADIHGNIYAFRKGWERLAREACDLYCFAGDICGYYYYQNEIIDILKEMKCLTSVAGNHDSMFIQMLDDDALEKQYNEKFGASSSSLKKAITPGNLDFLKALPEKGTVEILEIGIYHGSPWDPLEGYVYPADLAGRFKDLPHRLVILGHTHYPMQRREGSVTVINPGSIGQPRGGNLPSYAIFDTDTGRVRIEHFDYDPGPLIAEIGRRRESNSYLADILKRKKDA